MLHETILPRTAFNKRSIPPSSTTRCRRQNNRQELNKFVRARPCPHQGEMLYLVVGALGVVVVERARPGRVPVACRVVHRYRETELHPAREVVEEAGFFFIRLVERFALEHTYTHVFYVFVYLFIHILVLFFRLLALLSSCHLSIFVFLLCLSFFCLFLSSLWVCSKPRAPSFESRFFSWIELGFRFFPSLY